MTRVIVGCYTADLSQKFSRKSRKIAAAGGVHISTERRAVDDWETIEGGGMRAVGVGGGVNGMGADLIIVDDPVKSRKEAESITYRNSVYDWYTDDLYTRLEPNGAIIIIHTRWHEDDLSGRILASEDGPNWTVVKLPAEAEENDPLGRMPGEALCPARYDIDLLEDRRRVLGSYGYNALFQQRPTPAEGGIFKRSWVRQYTSAELPGKFDRVVQSWDMAFKDNADNSWIVGQVWGQLGAQFYLLDQIRGHWDFPETVKQFRKLCRKWPECTAKLVEDKANGPAVISTLKREITGLIPVPANDSKVARAYAVSAFFESGNVFIPKKAEWIDAYVSELLTFPNAAADDQVDTTDQALNYLGNSAVIMPLSAEHINHLCDNGRIFEMAGSGASIGIYQSDKGVYIAALKRVKGSDTRSLVYAEELLASEWGESLWGRVDKIVSWYDSPVLVVSANPDRYMARRLCSQHTPRASMAFYVESSKERISKGDPLDVDDGKWKVVLHRTETLDALASVIHQAGLDGRLTIPALSSYPVMDKLANQLTGLSKAKKSVYANADQGRMVTGEDEYVYISSGEDGFAHALNFALVGEELEPPKMEMGFF